MSGPLGIVTGADFGSVPHLNLRSPEFILAQALGLIHTIPAQELRQIIERAEFRKQHRPFDTEAMCEQEEAATVSLIDGATALLEIKDRLDAPPIHHVSGDFGSEITHTKEKR